MLYVLMDRKFTTLLLSLEQLTIVQSEDNPGIPIEK